MAGGGVVGGAAAVEGCLAGALAGGGLVGAAVDGLAGADGVAAVEGGFTGVAAGGGAVVVVEAPAGCVRHSAMNSFFVFLLA